MKYACVRCALIASCCWRRQRSRSRERPKFAGGSSTRRERVLPGVNVTVRNQDTGMFRETVSNRRRHLLRQRHRAGRVRDRSPSCRASRSTAARTSGSRSARRRRSTSSSRSAALEEIVTVSAESPIVDVTSKEVGGNVTARELVELPSVNRNFVGFVGLLPGIIPIDQHRVVRQRFDHRQRAGPAQQQLHARRRQQQRRRDRAARGHAGADADRGGAGVPGHHQPVRRRVRPHDRRDHQRRDQAGHERVPRQRVRVLPGRRPDREGLLREEEQTT